MLKKISKSSYLKEFEDSHNQQPEEIDLGFGKIDLYNENQKYQQKEQKKTSNTQRSKIRK